MYQVVCVKLQNFLRHKLQLLHCDPMVFRNRIICSWIFPFFWQSFEIKEQHIWPNKAFCDHRIWSFHIKAINGRGSLFLLFFHHSFDHCSSHESCCLICCICRLPTYSGKIIGIRWTCYSLHWIFNCWFSGKSRIFGLIIYEFIRNWRICYQFWCIVTKVGNNYSMTSFWTLV